MKKLIIIPLLLLAFLLSACGGSDYDEEIDAAIAADNEHISKPGIDKDIDSISRENVGIEVYDDGAIVSLTYELREGNEVTHNWLQQDDGTWEYKNDSVVEGKEPVYTENMDE